MRQTWERINPQNNRWTVMVIILGMLLLPASLVFAQSGVPIIDSILAFIDDYKLAITMVGVAIFALSLLMKPIYPDLWNNHRSSIVYMAAGGIVLGMIPAIATMLVG